MAPDQDIQSELKEVKLSLTRLFRGETCAKICKTIDYVERLNDNKKRLNGDPAVSHSFMVALKTAQMNLGPDAICCALLHDAIEDNPERDDIPHFIEKELGTHVLDMVRALTLINANPAEKSETKELEAAQQYLIATVSDLRIIMIKLADKLHNLMTIDGLPRDRQKRYMGEIERIYRPIVEYMGLGRICRELDDLLLKKKHPDEYEAILNFITRNYPTNEADVKTIISELETICALERIPVKIDGRVKSIASIYKKMRKYQKEGKTSHLDYIRDILAFRIITDTEKSCYTIASLISLFYEAQNNEMDDYITNPKPNGYKSLHLNIFHSNIRRILELQIKTQAMHENNEFGPASHIAYKTSGRSRAHPTDIFDWTASLNIQCSYYKTHEDKPITIELFKETIFVLTPDKDFIPLPSGATPIDLAYEIHSEMGTQCIGAIVNKRPVAVDTRLSTGDIVEIVTNSKKKYASKSWLEFVVTEKARREIQESVKNRLANL